MLQIENYLKYLNIKSSHKIADLGCGLGKTSMYISENIDVDKVYSIDIDEENLDRFKSEIEARDKLNKVGDKKDNYKNIEIIWGDLEQSGGTRLADGSIDIAIVENLIYTLNNKKSFLLELSRIIKSGGRVLVIDFHTPLGKSIKHSQMLLPKDYLENLFIEISFEIDQVKIENTNHHYAFIANKK
jgi:ubiquinone/menaquinone biosynthesis C-methylase UbiE